MINPSSTPVTPPSNAYTQIYRVRDIALKHPAYSYIGPAPDGTPDQDLWVTSFNAFGKDNVTRIPLAAAVDPKATPTPEVVTRKITWPNELTFQGKDVLVGSGFLLPWKSRGTVSRMPVDGKSDPVPLVGKRCGWFYHKVCPLPNGDLITARAKKPLFFGGPKGELVALHPEKDGKYTEEVLAKGPDFNILVTDLNGDGQTEIIAPEYFGEKLSLFTQNGKAWEETVIDPHLGPGFDCTVAKLNGPDAPPVLLVSNNESSGKGGVYAYEIPQHLSSDPWIKHTLVEGVPDGKSGPGTGAPGEVQTFYPGPHDDNARPGLLLSTDDGERLMWGLPTGKNFEYQFQRTESLDSTVGQPCVSPFKDADGFPFVFVPLYDKNVLRVYSFNPKYNDAPPPTAQS